MLCCQLKKQIKLDGDLERAFRKLGTVMLSNWCSATVCFLVKIIPVPIHFDDYDWACRKSCAIPGDKIALLEPTFSDLTWTGIEEEGNGKRSICSLATASFLQAETHIEIPISRCIYFHI